jgi:hypothetical protein
MKDEYGHGDEVCDAEYWIEVELLVVSVIVREQEVEVSVNNGVLLDAGTVI